MTPKSSKGGALQPTSQFMDEGRREDRPPNWQSKVEKFAPNDSQDQSLAFATSLQAIQPRIIKPSKYALSHLRSSPENNKRRTASKRQSTTWIIDSRKDIIPMLKLMCHRNSPLCWSKKANCALQYQNLNFIISKGYMVCLTLWKHVLTSKASLFHATIQKWFALEDHQNWGNEICMSLAKKASPKGCKFVAWVHTVADKKREVVYPEKIRKRWCSCKALLTTWICQLRDMILVINKSKSSLELLIFVKVSLLLCKWGRWPKSKPLMSELPILSGKKTECRKLRGRETGAPS